MITSNKDNLDKLIEAVQGAQKDIMICSAWIRSETLSRLFNEKVKKKLKKGEVKLRVIVRLGEAVDVKITNPEVFNLVQELNGEIKYHRKLHAKLYAVDDNFAMLGSFNLTGGGFGNDQRPAYVSKGVLAQCSTQAIFGLVNGGDISTIAETVEGISDEELKLLPRFKQGEGIFTGVAIDEPVLV